MASLYERRNQREQLNKKEMKHVKMLLEGILEKNTSDGEVRKYEYFGA